MGPRIHLGVRLDDRPIPINNVGDALGLAIGTVGSAIGQAYAAVGVAQQWIREIVLGREGRVRLYAVDADAQYLCVFRLVIQDSITESLPFRRSATGVGNRVKPEYDRLSGVVAQLDLSARVGGDRKARCPIANLEHSLLLLYEALLLKPFAADMTSAIAESRNSPHRCRVGRRHRDGSTGTRFPVPLEIPGMPPRSSFMRMPYGCLGKLWTDVWKLIERG